MSDVTEQDREAAAALLDEVMFGGHSHDGANETVARALAAEREKARAPFLALCDPETSGLLIPRAAIRRAAREQAQ